jgi:hypothetical protein
MRGQPVREREEFERRGSRRRRNFVAARAKGVEFATAGVAMAVFAFRRYEDSSLRYTGIESHEGLRHYGLYDTVVAVT